MQRTDSPEWLRDPRTAAVSLVTAVDVDLECRVDRVRRVSTARPEVRQRLPMLGGAKRHPFLRGASQLGLYRGGLEYLQLVSAGMTEVESHAHAQLFHDLHDCCYVGANRLPLPELIARTVLADCTENERQGGHLVLMAAGERATADDKDAWADALEAQGRASFEAARGLRNAARALRRAASAAGAERSA